jgi:hypothetical protein
VLLYAQKNAQNWQKYTTAAHNSHITISIIPNLNHLLQHCSTCTTTEYAQLPETIAPVVLQEITNWLKTI